jgi:hypothetical protein
MAGEESWLAAVLLELGYACREWGLDAQFVLAKLLGCIENEKQP